MKLQDIANLFANPEYVCISFDGKTYPYLLSKLSPDRYKDMEICEIACYEDEIFIHIKPPFDEKGWIEKMCAKFVNDKYSIKFVSNGKNVIVYDLDNPKKVGWAKCKDNDKYLEEKGIAIAYARLKNYPIPEEL